MGMQMGFGRWMLALLLLGVFSLPAQAGEVRNISPIQAREILAGDTHVFLLDVRTPEEYRQVRIAGAHLIPIDTLVRRIGEIPAGRPLLVYCAVGSRSDQVAGYLANRGYGEVYNMVGGVMGWQLRGLPVLQGGP
jgi:rhodanese-related sulfurtransferase